MRIVIAGGGTGGHFFPGLAVAQRLVETDASASVLFVGSDDGIEAKAAAAHGFSFVPVRMRAFRGAGLAGRLRSLARLLPAILASRTALRSFGPNLVVGLGSYASVPVALAARTCRISVVLMEQNVVPGFANRLLGRFAVRICTTFTESANYFPSGRTEQTGNPVRKLEAVAAPQRGGFTVFVFGGSQGAHSINIAALEASRPLATLVPGLRVIHQTGSADCEMVRAGYRERGVDAEVHAFIHDMAAAYGQADLVVSRAGASTLAEIAALGKPAILIPYPVAADDHQRKNAEVIVEKGAARMLLDRDLSAATLAAAISELAGAPQQLAAMATAIRTFATPDAADRVLNVCRSVVEEGH